MLLATRCPFCETVFRIQAAQLAARRGLVRCGHCQETFDASGSLFEVPDGGDFAQAVPVAAELAAGLIASASAEPSASAAAPASTAAAPVPATGGVEPAAFAPPTSAPGAAGPTPPSAPDFAGRAWDPWAPRPNGEADTGLGYNAQHLPQPTLAPAGVVPKTARDPQEPWLAPDAAAPADPSPAAAAATAPRWARVEPDLAEPTLPEHASPLADDEPVLPAGSTDAAPAAGFAALPPSEGAEPFAVTREAPAEAPRRRTGARIVGGLVAVLLLVLLVAQLAWWLRETVMAYWPASQPLYAQACAQLGCHVLPPRDIDGLQVEPSDLRQVDDPHRLELKVPLRNRFDVALAYPAIELTLLDRQNNIVVRRVLAPRDYVNPGTRIEAGLPAHMTQTMIVRLDTGNVVASNFRVEIFYP